MSHCRHLLIIGNTALAGLSLLVLAARAAEHDERVSTDAQGRIIVTPLATPAHLRNPWPVAWEDAFVTRRSDFIKQYKGAATVNTALENEKQGYPPSILAFCAGDRAPALAALQAEDADAGDNALTEGIDYYWCFTLKGQMRKYFFLGPYLNPDYRARMRAGATAWVATDPRPNTELVLLLNSADPQVAAYARDALRKLWRSPDQLRAMAAEALREYEDNPRANQADLKKQFAVYVRAWADRVGATPPGTPQEWIAWWSDLCQGDWMVFEEYDRRTNLRPHPRHGIGSGPVGTDWAPQSRGGIVDWRNTDNLRAMRESSVYLMAEETGSELVRRVFKERIRTTARSIFSIGNGEWDSPAYLSHTASAYLNLYDFAKDEEVRLLAKAILDFVATSAAVKYYQGGFCGPNKRDYGTLTPECGPGSMMHFWVGPAGAVTPKENDLAHYATSAYRPPAAVVALARKQFARPAEVLATHPTYQTWLPGNDAEPQYHETTFFANTYQIGSMLEGGDYDGAGCKILVENESGSVDYLVPSSQRKGNLCVNREHNDRIAQYRNLLLWINRPATGRTQWNILVPAGAILEQVDGVAFLRFARSWCAIRGANATFSGFDEARKSAFGRKRSDVPGSILAGDANAEGPSGLALEMGEAQTHGDYAAFKRAVLAKGALDTSLLADGKLVFTGALGTSVALQWNGAAPSVWRNGKPHDLVRDHRALWQPADGGTSPVALGWKTGVLHVEAGGHAFTGTLNRDTGIYTFVNTLAK